MELENLRIECKDEFERRLTCLREELIKSIEPLNLLDKNVYNNFIYTYKTRLSIFQKDYIDFIQKKLNYLSTYTENIEFSSKKNTNLITEIASALIAAGTASFLASTIPVTTTIIATTVPVTTYYFFSLLSRTDTKIIHKTVSITSSELLSNLLNISTYYSNAIIGLIFGIVVAFMINRFQRKKRGKDIKKKIISTFDNEISTKLRNWALNQLKF